MDAHVPQRPGVGELRVYKLAFFVPPSHVDVVKAAVFAAGGGRIGDYDCCAWQVLGQGQFRPLDGSQPFLGQTGVVEQIEEWRVELVVTDELIGSVVAALKLSHPYETPAYEVWQLADF
ncbi:GTP cyclohydrolase 1 type 2 [Pseudomonas fluorescens]|uniref:GTP cyclohydrolase 1 type 2 n=1 Tax=Pseudomonas fluorescens TaxID=294 RepID=A0A5E6WF77_PSEFL|nr:GTP cyclohydrolase 1 type 2 [Pseudomonas fluorescens]